MSCFDTVRVRCICGTDVDFQSKGGACDLRVYPAHKVPVGVAAGCDADSVTCPTCGGIVSINVAQSTVAMEVTVDSLEGDGDDD